MLNLFSFVFGLFSSLLYALVRVVLLLDRLICAVYALPLWRWLADAVRGIGRHRAVCAAVVFVPMMAVPGALLLHSGTMVYADGRPLGLIENPDALSAAVDAIEQSASSLAGEEYTLPVTIETRTLRAP